MADFMLDPYAIDEREFPAQGSTEEQFAFLLRYVILAPSTHNTQPWKFSLGPAGIDVYADYRRRLPVSDAGNRELLLSIGAAVTNLRIAAAHFGFRCRVKYNDSGDSEQPIASAVLASGEQAAADPLAVLFPLLPRRHTNRNPFLLSRIPSAVLEKFSTLGEQGGASLYISTDGKINAQVGDLVAAADRVQQGDSTVRQEHAEWVRPSWTGRADGIPGSAFGLSGVAAALSPWTTRVLDLGRVIAARDRNLCIEAPGLIVVQSEDSVPRWLEAGELLERLLLTVVGQGLQYSYFNMPLQVPELRIQVRRVLGLSAWPQVMLRIGYCLTEAGRTPRRPLEEVLMARVHV